MGDIDFDELDKAVNSLMGNVKPGKDKDEAPKEKKLEVKDTLKPGEEPVYNKLGEVAGKIGNEALVTEREQTLVEHFELSEASEKPSVKINEAVQKIGSETLDAESKDSVKESDDSEQEPDENNDKESEKEKPTSEKAPAPAAKRSASGRFMDVVHPSSDMRTAAPASSPSVATRTIAPLTVSAPPSPPSDGDPGQTPFLPDANDKVEKRPLGAIPSPFDNEDDSQKSDEVHEDEKTETAVETSLINSEGRPEATNDGKDVQQSIDATALAPEVSEEEKLLQEIEATEATETPAEQQPETIEKVESGDTEELRKGSEDKSDKHHKTDDAAGAIYDTKEYHQPVVHPKKQKSGWGKVLIIVLIIIIFAAAGGAAYLLTT